MHWKQNFLNDWAGPPLQVALSILITTFGGILVGHGLFSVELSTQLFASALAVPLVFVVVAGLWKSLDG
ncbi:hypothetical protein [Thiohalomonas denitrificans]|uniref:Uncharacterized protein n=1 Tax=Thiohalomonas denitrificans TaxID=415747 RepID=A0A1G5R2Q5_9GAMM|nr:hypothetical protein [Thiohalomonas denitrificans]SCZ68352.1 hypothetical protein SAMN03097708_03297 [Thiohalomonas denitrificans]